MSRVSGPTTQFHFNRIEVLARLRQAQQSRLSRQALFQHGRRSDPAQITDALNRVYGAAPSRLHAAWRLVQLISQR